MVTQEHTAEIERKTTYQSNKSLRGLRSAAVELYLSLVKSAGDFQYIAGGFICEFYFESVYVPINATVLCLGKGQRRKSTECL